MTERPLQLAPDFSLPLAAATRRMAILAMSGAGKSNAAVVLAEAMFDAGIPWVAIDPKGDWWGVRSSKSGKGPGLPIPIFGGAHGDLPLEPGAGKVLAQTVHAQRLTCVVDVSEFDEMQQMWGFLRDFGGELLRLHKQKPRVCHLFLEECDEYIPQRPSEKGMQIKCLSVWQRVVKKGRTPGLGTTQITQRSASLNKDTLYQAELLIALRVTGKGDRDAIRGWVEYHHAGEEIVDSLATLRDGEAWAVSPGWLRDARRVRFSRRRTFDSGATPELLDIESTKPAATLADVDLGALRERMAATIEKAKAEDPALLQQRVRQLERELAAAKKAPAVRIEPKVETKTERVAVPMLTEEHLAALKGAAAAIQATFAGARGLVEQLAQDRGALTDALHAIDVAIARATAPAKRLPAQTPGRVVVATRLAAAPRAKPFHAAREGAHALMAASLSRPQQALLDALAWLESMRVQPARREQMALVAKVSSASSGFEKNVSTLRTTGLISYPSGNMVELTDAGRAQANPPDVPPTTAELHEALYARLSRPQAALLRVLIDAYPESLSREELGARAGQSPLSSGFEKNVSTLRSLGLVDYPDKGHVQALAVLFLEGAA